jgi:hypothetical protein
LEKASNSPSRFLDLDSGLNAKGIDRYIWEYLHELIASA